MLLVVGLGNPGRQYSTHRHNVGFMVVDEVAAACKADVFRAKFNGEYTRVTLAGEDVVLLKPQTFMNESGRSVQAAVAFYKPSVDRLLVIHDELDLPFGTTRLKVGGGHAGHNGLRSIMACIGSGEFGRIRFGIGRPPPGFRGEVADYVLSGFDGSERAELPDLLKKAAATITEVASRGLAAAMNVSNVRPKPARAPKQPKPAPGAPPPQGALPPGDVRQSLPGDVRQSLPGDVRQSLPGDVRQSLPGDVRQSLSGSRKSDPPADKRLLN